MITQTQKRYSRIGIMPWFSRLQQWYGQNPKRKMQETDQPKKNWSYLMGTNCWMLVLYQRLNQNYSCKRTLRLNELGEEESTWFNTKNSKYEHFTYLGHCHPILQISWLKLRAFLCLIKIKECYYSLSNNKLSLHFYLFTLCLPLQETDVHLHIFFKVLLLLKQYHSVTKTQVSASWDIT